MKTITKITGLLILLASFGFANAAKILAASPSISADKTELIFTISETAGGKPAPEKFGVDPNVVIDILFTGFELRGTKDDVTGLSTYFEATDPDDTIGNITLSQIAEIPIGTSFGGTFSPLSVTIPVTLTSDRDAITGEAGFEVIVGSRSASTVVEDPTAIPVKAFQAITGGGVNQPNYSIGMNIVGNAGSSLGTSESKELPLNIVVTETANAANTAGNNVVVALAKDSRIESVASDCGGTDWSLDNTNPVAYLFTYTANSNAFPANTPSTIVCPVTVTRPTTQSGKLQLNAVLRHGSGDTKTSNDVASIEVTYN